jgi:hypothetical protein
MGGRLVQGGLGTRLGAIRDSQRRATGSHAAPPANCSATTRITSSPGTPSATAGTLHPSRPSSTNADVTAASRPAIRWPEPPPPPRGPTVIGATGPGSDHGVGEGSRERAGACVAAGMPVPGVKPPDDGVGAMIDDGALDGVADGLAVAVGDGVGPEPPGVVGRAVGAGVDAGVAVGFGVGAGVGLGVGAGVGLGVGFGVGGGVDDPLAVNDRPTVGKSPEPHLVVPAESGLSCAVAVHDIVPGADADPVTRNTAESPAGSPISALLSDGFLNAMRIVPPDEDEYAAQSCVAADVTPFTERTAKELTANDAGMSTITHVISSPPPSPPTFWTVNVIAVCTST